MEKKTPLEILNEVKDALDFQLVVMNATGASNINLRKDHAFICLIAIEKMISAYSTGETNTVTEKGGNCNVCYKTI